MLVGPHGHTNLISITISNKYQYLTNICIKDDGSRFDGYGEYLIISWQHNEFTSPDTLIATSSLRK
jgi:hypothetical protein